MARATWRKMLARRGPKGRPLGEGYWWQGDAEEPDCATFPWRALEEPTDEGVIWRLEVEGPGAAGVEAVMALIDAQTYKGTG